MTTATDKKTAKTQGITNTTGQTPIPKIVMYKAGAEEIQLTIGMVTELLVKPTKNGKLPSKADIVKFIMLCKSQKLNPWTGDAFLVGYDGARGPEFSLLSSHASLLKRADVQEAYKGLASGVIVKDEEGMVEDKIGKFRLDEETLLGGWAEVKIEGKDFSRKKIRLQAFYKDNKFWNRDKEGMIVKCAEAAALREAFPNILAGSYIREEMSQAIDVTAEVEILKVDVPLLEGTAVEKEQKAEPAPRKNKARKSEEGKAKKELEKEPDPAEAQPGETHDGEELDSVQDDMPGDDTGEDDLEGPPAGGPMANPLSRD